MASLAIISCPSAFSANSDSISVSTASLKKPQKICVKTMGSTPPRWARMEALSSKIKAVGCVSVNGYPASLETESLVPLTKQMVDNFRQATLIEGGVAYRQTVVVRSYEVGPDKTATVETFLNLFQETALNHVWMSGLLGDGFGATHGMIRNNLIWVVSRMQVQVQTYPLWGEVVEIDTWVGASGKNGMRRDWVIRRNPAGQILARATSTWVMMNKHTRRLSKMPDVVRAEVSPWFLTRRAIEEASHDKIMKLDSSNAEHIVGGLKPRRSDLDMNHHVNNVKYVGWMLETVPEWVQEAHQLSTITLEYRRECGRSDVVQSLCNRTADIQCQTHHMEFTHLLGMQGESDASKGEIVRAKTTWRRKGTWIA